MAMTLSGHPCGYARFAYTLEAGGHRFPTVSEMWIVPRGDFAFLIGAGVRQDGKTGTRKDIKRIIDTIKSD